MSDPNANGGAYRVSNVQNDKATVKFKGTSVQWVTKKGPDQGKAQVTIDGASKGVVDLFNATTQVFTKTVSSLANTNHIIVVSVMHQKNANSNGYNVAVDAFVAGTATIQDSDCAVEYNTWICAKNANASSGTFHYASSAGDVVNLTFTGDGINWIGEKGPNFGRAKVTITNSSVCPTAAPCQIDLYSPTVKWQTLIRSFTGLGAGQHTILIRPLGAKNAKSTGYRVAVDMFGGRATMAGDSLQDPASEGVGSPWVFVLPLGVLGVGAFQVRRRRGRIGSRGL